MKLTLDISPDLVAMMVAEIAAGERAVTTAMREVGTGLKTAWRGRSPAPGSDRVSPIRSDRRYFRTPAPA
jgi:hypothetical protein